MLTFARPALVIVLSCLTMEWVAADEVESAPKIQGASQHGFGGFGLRPEETQYQAKELAFLASMHEREDETCRSNGNLRVRNLVYLEFQRKLIVKSELKEPLSLGELKKYIAFMNEVNGRSKGFTFAFASMDGQKFFESDFAVDMMHFESAVDSALMRGVSGESKKIRLDKNSSFGLLNHSLSSVGGDLGAFKAMQLMAQMDSDLSVKACRTTLFSDANNFQLSQGLQSISKCRLEEDVGCFAKWSAYCPSLQVTLFDALKESDLSSVTQGILTETDVRKLQCANNFIRIAQEIMPINLLPLSLRNIEKKDALVVGVK